MTIDYNIVGVIAGFASVVVAMVALWLESKKTRLTTQADILLRLDERFCCSEMRTLRGNASGKLLAGKLPNNELGDILDFFSNLAYMVNRGALDMELVYAPFEYWITGYWCAAQGYISKQRQFDPESWLTLENLIKRMELMKKSTEAHLSDESLRAFLEEEAQYGRSDFANHSTGLL